MSFSKSFGLSLAAFLSVSQVYAVDAITDHCALLKSQGFKHQIAGDPIRHDSLNEIILPFGRNSFQLFITYDPKSSSPAGKTYLKVDPDRLEITYDARLFDCQLNRATCENLADQVESIGANFGNSSAVNSPEMYAAKCLLERNGLLRKAIIDRIGPKND